MSLHPQSNYAVPAQTAQVAKAIFPKGNLCITMADCLSSFLCDEDFSALFSSQGQPGVSPLRLALVTILQYVEGLTDRQAADAVRSRIDWKYLLCLELTDTGFDHTVLSEFRTRLITEHAESLVFEKLLIFCQQQEWLQARGRQRTDSTHVLASIRAVTRLECAGETLRAALNALAVVVPDWLQVQSQPEWVALFCYFIQVKSKRSLIYQSRLDGRSSKIIHDFYQLGKSSFESRYLKYLTPRLN